jgi:uncharacterized surface protein with fasciclin (FAS1) repeats
MTGLKPPHSRAGAFPHQEEFGMKIRLMAAAAALTMALGAGAMAQTDPMVGGAAMYPSKNIIENAVNSKDHTTLVAAVKAAGLVETLQGPGPFTVFAPTNEAFAALPPGTVDNLLKPENKAMLTKVLTYHVVAGKYDSMALATVAKSAPGGKVALKTVEGEPLTVSQSGGGWMVTDTKGGSARITIPNVYQSNGVIMVVDKVLMP